MEPRAISSIAARLAFDYEVTSALHSPCLDEVRAFSSYEEYRAGRDISAAHGLEGRATFYFVKFNVPTLAPGGRTITGVGICFDLLAGGNYPYTPPAVTVVTRPIPWSPHFGLASGAVCIGNIWALLNGRMLFPQLLGHLARLLNFDEPAGTPELLWQPDAELYWHQVLKCRPISPDLEYPVLPTELTHVEAVPSESEQFAAIDDDFVAFAHDDFLPLEVGP